MDSVEGKGKYFHCEVNINSGCSVFTRKGLLEDYETLVVRRFDKHSAFVTVL